MQKEEEEAEKEKEKTKKGRKKRREEKQSFKRNVLNFDVSMSRACHALILFGKSPKERHLVQIGSILYRNRKNEGCARGVKALFLIVERNGEVLKMLAQFTGEA